LWGGEIDFVNLPNRPNCISEWFCTDPLSNNLFVHIGLKNVKLVICPFLLPDTSNHGHAFFIFLKTNCNNEWCWTYPLSTNFLEDYMFLPVQLKPFVLEGKLDILQLCVTICFICRNDRPRLTFRILCYLFCSAIVGLVIKISFSLSFHFSLALLFTSWTSKFSVLGFRWLLSGDTYWIQHFL